jgi:predicted membrane protein
MRLGLFIVLKLSTISTYVSYSISIIAFIFGAIVMSGVAFQYVPNKMRITFGVVLMLWGIYRLVSTRNQVRQQNEKDEEEE